MKEESIQSMINMNDVAKEAGVSRGTVSNYLNDRTVRPESKIKIEDAISKLHYVRNTAARDLRASKSTFVVLIIPTVWTPFFAELTDWIQKGLDAKGYKMILCVSNSDYSQEREYVRMAEEQRVAGIITISYSSLTKHVSVGMPLVAIEKEETGSFPLVTSDNYDGGRLAAQEFQQRGVEQFVCLGVDHVTSGAMLARQTGFTDYCNERKLSNKVYHLPSNRHIEACREVIHASLEDLRAGQNFGKIGIFTITDAYAKEVVKYCNENGISIPCDVQVIGFDGSLSAQNGVLELSSIRQPVEEIAKTSIEQLDKQIKQEVTDTNDINRIILPITFQAGPTTKPVQA